MENRKIIASLTSYPGRINIVHRVIESILKQSFPPDKIILYLADEQFPNHTLPENLTKMMQDNPEFEIRWFPRDIKSYKKLVPALLEFPKDIIITFDDDIIYPDNIIKRLMKKHRKYPEAICGCRVKLITFTKGELNKYREWKRYRPIRLLLRGGRPRFRNIATTGGGALFPPFSLHPYTIREDVFMELCPTTDDLWFWAMAILNGNKTAPAGKFLTIDIIEESQSEALTNINFRGENLNDKNMKKILETYPDIMLRMK